MSHIHELIDFTVSIYIVYENKVLLRFHDKYDFWGPPSGHVELNEDPNEAAIRESKEEVGLDIELLRDTEEPFTFTKESRKKKLVPPRFMQMHPTGDNHQHCDMIYFASCSTFEVNPMERSDLSNDWKWLTREELEKMNGVWDDIKYYAKSALKIQS